MKTDKQIRVDEKEGLIWIPGKDQPEELIAPIQQRVDKETGQPYQHVLTAQEIAEAKEQHDRCMRFLRDAMKATWKCSKCGRVYAGTQLRPSEDLMGFMGELLKPGGVSVDWNSITEHLASHLQCPYVGIVDAVPVPCRGACKPEEKKP